MDGKDLENDPGFDIAVVGVAGRFPKSPDLGSFFNNLLNGNDLITRFSDEELKVRGIKTSFIKNPNYVKVGSVLEDAESFDNELFNIAPAEAELLDPQRRIFLETVYDALYNAGYDPFNIDDLTGVYASSSTLNYLFFNLRHLLDLERPSQALRAWLANDKDYISTYTSYKFNFKGPSISIQTACSSSLVAVASACQSLISFQCDMAVAGGVSVTLPQHAGYHYDIGSMNSPDGYCRPFDANASGTVFGNGSGVVILKRLDAAIRDKNYIHGIIKSFAVNNDGKDKVGFTAPCVEGQVQVINDALDLAQICPSTIGYVEAHGTGTALGDPIELEALKTVYQSDVTKGSCPIGSVKGNMGHLNAAAGVAGLIKSMLCIKYGKIPATLNHSSPNPDCGFENSPFFVNTDTIDFNHFQSLKRAAVSSFGIGGTNAHVILEEPPKDYGQPEWSKGTDDRNGLNLKSYAFSRKPFLIEPPVGYIGLSDITDHAADELLGNQCLLPLSSQIIFDTLFSRERLPYLSDHRLYGNIVVSGAIFIAMALEAGHKTNEYHHSSCSGVQISNTVFPAALSIPEEDQVTVQLVIDKDNPRRFRIISIEDLENNSSDYTLHTSGTFTFSDDDIKETSATHHYNRINLAEIRGRLKDSLEPKRIFEVLEHYNVQLGPSHRWISRILRSDIEVLCDMSIPAGVKRTEEFLLHPGLIDSCFQVLAASQFTEDKKTFVPFSIKSFNYFNTIESKSLYAYGILKQIDRGKTPRVIGDIFLCNENGELIAEIIELESRQASLERLQQQESKRKQWQYGITWERENILSRTDSETNRENHWLLICEDFTGFINARNEGSSFSIYRLNDDGSCSENFTCWLKNQSEYVGVIFVAPNSALTDSELTLENIVNEQKKTAARWLDIAKHLHKLGNKSDCCLVSVTSNSQELPERSVTNPWHAPLWGMTQAFRQEAPYLKMVNIDLDECLTSSFGLVLTEANNCLNNKQFDSHVAFHQSQRYVGKLEKRSISPATNKLVFEEAALILGGTGALGMACAERILGKGVEHVYLMSRSGDSRTNLSKLDALSEKHKECVTIINGDVSNIDDVNRALKTISVNNHQLKGVIQAAGVLDDGMIQNQNFNRYIDVFLPKAVGVWNLHQATVNISLNYFVCFSSTAAVMGAMGQSTYAGANAFMDALCWYKKSLGQNALSVNWGAFSDMGMASELHTTQRRHATLGISSISIDEGISALFDAMKCSDAQRIIIPINWNQFSQAVDLDRLPSVYQKVVKKTSNIRSTKENEVSWHPDLQGLSFEERHKKLVGLMAQIVAEELGLSVNDEEFDLTKGFFDLGVDSLVSVNIHDKIQKHMPAPLAPTLMFDYPNLNDLATQLIESHFSDDLEDNALIADIPISKLSTNHADSSEEMSEQEAFEMLRSTLDLKSPV